MPYSENRLSYWIQEYAQKGWEGICVWEYQGSHAHLSDEQQQHLKNHVSQTVYRRIQEVVVWVKDEWGAENHYYFVDAAHPNHTSVMGYQWALKGQRPQVLSNSGRQRLNILGAYSPCEQDYVGFESTENINAESMIQLVKQLEEHQPLERIILICDNARYNHARLLKDYLADTQSSEPIIPPLPTSNTPFNTFSNPLTSMPMNC